jgi:ankyrin repeat protein
LIDSAEQICYKVLGFSSPYVDYRESVISAKGKRVEGTCEWILGHTNYHAWLNGDIRLLWISGGPGKGKTMMSIFLTEHLEQKIPTMENTQLVYFFFSFQDRNRNTGVLLLQSLIYQIVIKRPQLKTHMLPYINFQSEPSLESLWAIFKKLIQDPELGTMLCVLDGLDESDRDATHILLPRLIELLSPNLQSSLYTTFRLIVVSRDISGLEDCTRVKLDPDNNESVHGDINKFISIRIRDLSRIIGSRHECEIEVQDTLLERAEGTFLWVGFAMYELMQKRTWTEVFDALKTLPSGLPAIYSRMLHQIPAGHRKISSRILQWVTMALQPLTLLEIATAIGLETSSPLISLEHATKDEITLCGSFLKVQGPEVTLIHQSVRDYILDQKSQNDPVLETFRIKSNEAHFEMAQICLQFIKQSSLQQSPLSHWVQRGEPPLLRYAARHWLKHAASCSDLTVKLFESTQHFFTYNRRLRENWWKVYLGYHYYWRSHIETPPLLHLACDLEIVPWVEMIIQENRLTGRKCDKMLLQSFLDQTDSNGRTALHYAASSGNYPLVHLLVQSGADISAEDRGETALHFAAKSWNDSGEIVQFLLDQGADIHAPGTEGRTALHEAIREENLQVFRILLDRGACIECTDCGGSTALHFAARGGKVDIVQLLLDRGASLEWADSRGSTALHIAAASRDVNTVQLLLDRGASLEEVNSNGSTALHCAAGCGNVDTAQLLLDRGADIQAKTFEGETALHSATGATVFHLQEALFPGMSRIEMSGVVQLLLDKGADSNARDSKGKTAFDSPRYIRFFGRGVWASEEEQARAEQEVL